MTTIESNDTYREKIETIMTFDDALIDDYDGGRAEQYWDDEIVELTTMIERDVGSVVADDIDDLLRDRDYQEALEYDIGLFAYDDNDIEPQDF